MEREDPACIYPAGAGAYRSSRPRRPLSHAAMAYHGWLMVSFASG